MLSLYPLNFDHSYYFFPIRGVSNSKPWFLFTIIPIIELFFFINYISLFSNRSTIIFLIVNNSMTMEEIDDALQITIYNTPKYNNNDYIV